MPLAGQSTSVGDRSIATTLRAAARRLDGQGAGAAAGIEHAHAVQVGGQPGQQRGAHAVAPGAHGGADAAHRRVEVSRAQACAAVRSK